MCTLHHAHKRFPEKLAFFLDNPLRRLLQPPQRLISKLEIKSTDVVVDFGCGPGFYAIPIARIAKKTIGVDASEVILQRASKTTKKNNIAVEFLKSEGTKLELIDSSVDLIFLGHVFHEIENKTGTLREFFRILKPEGRIAILERTKRALLEDKMGPPLIQKSEVIDMLEPIGFNLRQEIAHGKGSLIIFGKQT